MSNNPIKIPEHDRLEAKKEKLWYRSFDGKPIPEALSRYDIYRFYEEMYDLLLSSPEVVADVSIVPGLYAEDALRLQLATYNALRADRHLLPSDFTGEERSIKYWADPAEFIHYQHKTLRPKENGLTGPKAPTGPDSWIAISALCLMAFDDPIDQSAHHRNRRWGKGYSPKQWDPQYETITRLHFLSNGTLFNSNGTIFHDPDLRLKGDLIRFDVWWTVNALHSALWSDENRHRLDTLLPASAIRVVNGAFAVFQEGICCHVIANPVYIAPEPFDVSDQIESMDLMDAPIIMAFPEREDGRKLVIRGFSTFNVDTWFSEWSIQDPHLIRRIAHADIREKAIRRFGFRKYFASVRAVIVHQDEVPITPGSTRMLPRFLVDIPRSEDETVESDRWLVGIDGSTERVYIMPSSKDVSTCAQAHQRLSGLPDNIVTHNA